MLVFKSCDKAESHMPKGVEWSLEGEYEKGSKKYNNTKFTQFNLLN